MLRQLKWRQTLGWNQIFPVISCLSCSSKNTCWAHIWPKYEFWAACLLCIVSSKYSIMNCIYSLLMCHCQELLWTCRNLPPIDASARLLTKSCIKSRLHINTVFFSAGQAQNLPFVCAPTTSCTGYCYYVNEPVCLLSTEITAGAPLTTGHAMHVLWLRSRIPKTDI